MDPEAAAVARQAEERASGAIVGVDGDRVPRPPRRPHRRRPRPAPRPRRGDPPPPARRRRRPEPRRAVGQRTGRRVEQRRPPRRRPGDARRRVRRRQPVDLPRAQRGAVGRRAVDRRPARAGDVARRRRHRRARQGHRLAGRPRAVPPRHRRRRPDDLRHRAARALDEPRSPSASAAGPASPSSCSADRRRPERSTAWARSSTTSAPSIASSIDGGPTTLALRLPPPTTMRSRSITRPSIHSGRSGRQGERRHAADRHAGELGRHLGRGERRLLARPSRLRTTRLTSSRVEASTTQAAYTGGTSALRRLADHDDGVRRVVELVAVGGAELGRVGERRIAVDHLDAGEPGDGVADPSLDLVHGCGRLGPMAQLTSPARPSSCCRR